MSSSTDASTLKQDFEPTRGAPLTVQDGDPLAKVLVSSGWSPIKAGVALFLAFALAIIIGMAVYLVRDREVRVEFLGDWVGVAISAVFYLVVPFGVGYFYLWQTRKLNRLFSELHSAKVFGSWTSNETIAGVHNRFLGSFQARPWRYGWYILVGGLLLAFLMVALDVHFQLISLEGQQERVRYLSTFTWIWLPAAMLGMYLVGMIVMRSLTCSVALASVLRSPMTFQVQPLHPDRCGGLQALNKYALGTAYHFAIWALGLAAIAVNSNQVGNLLADWGLWLMVGAYIFVGPISTFGPLWAGHRPMKRYKEEQLQGVSMLFQQEYETTRNLVNQRSSESARQSVRLEELRKLHQTIQSFPEWPFYAANLGRIATTVLAPLVPAILTIATKFSF